jgi:ABC-type transporter Mla MlaB component
LAGPERRDVIVVAIGGAVDRAEIPAWCRLLRARLERNASPVVICDVGKLLVVDVVAVDLLARLQLTARRGRRQFRVRRASAALVDLLTLLGLSEVVLLERERGLPSEGQPEEGEQARGVEEEADPGDPSP